MVIWYYEYICLEFKFDNNTTYISIIIVLSLIFKIQVTTSSFIKFKINIFYEIFSNIKIIEFDEVML